MAEALSAIAVKALAVSEWGVTTERLQVMSLPGISRLFLLSDIMTEIAYQESRFVPDARGPVGEWGLWQIHPQHVPKLVAAGIITKDTDLTSPANNVKAAKWVYDQQGLDAWTTADKAIEAIGSGQTESGNVAQAQTTPGLFDNLVPDWASGLTRLLSIITSADFWKRIGLGVLGAAVILIAVILWNKDTIAGTVGKVM
jgi:hypothetical protein